MINIDSMSDLNYKLPILVSNGIGVLNHTAGHIIDKFDVVVRFGNFKITPETIPFCGNKTSEWMNGGNAHILPRPIEEVNKVIIMSNKDWWGLSSYDEGIPIRILEIQDYADILRSLSPDPNFRDFSLGLFAIVYYTRLYPAIYCYGFDGLSTDGHYYDKTHVVAQCHNSTIENHIRGHFKQTGKVIDLENYL